MFESILVITIYLFAVFTPVLIPATAHAVHLFSEWRRTYRPVLRFRPVRVPRPVVSRRLAVPAMG